MNTEFELYEYNVVKNEFVLIEILKLTMAKGPAFKILIICCPLFIANESFVLMLTSG
jgi:hypothetical protein